MKTRTLPRASLLAVVTTVALAACNPSTNSAQAPATAAPSPGAAPAASAGEAPVTVDGRPITLEALDFVSRNNAGKKYEELTEDQKKKLTDDLVRIQLLANEAIAKGKDKDRDIVVAIDLGRLNVLMQSTLTDYLRDKQPTEAEVRAYYEQWIKEAPRMQYHIQMISVQTQPYAEDIEAELKKGADFVAIAKREASGEAAKQQAGQGGWVTLESLSPALANAISALKVGEYTSSPVQLPEGWGIIRLQEIKAAQKPEFDRVRQGLAREMVAKKVDALVDELRKKAKIVEAPAKKG